MSDNGPTNEQAQGGPYRTSDPESLRLNTGSLVGSYFQGDAASGGQGLVVAEPATGIYLIELFESVAGSSTYQQLVHIEGMRAWQFDDTEWMRAAHEHGLQTRRRVEQNRPEPTDSDERGTT